MDIFEYEGITIELDALTNLNKELRELFAKDQDGKTAKAAKESFLFPARYILLQAAEGRIAKLVNRLNDFKQPFYDDIQTQGKKPGPSIPRVADAMARLVEVASNEIPGMMRLYRPIVEVCNDMLVQYNYYCQARKCQEAQKDEKRQEAIDQFKKDLTKTEQYKAAINDGRIKSPFTWTGSLVALVDWLQRLPHDVLPIKNVQGLRQVKWSVADNVFLIDGKPVSGRRLRDTNAHQPKQY